MQIYGNKIINYVIMEVRNLKQFIIFKFIN